MTTQARELAKIVNNAGDLFFVDDVALASDGAVLNFGADNDVTLTHVADTGLLINSTRQLQFGDSGTYIHQSADGVLDLVSDTEIELNATTLDINANVDISGTLTVAGALDFGDLDISNVGSIALDTITNDGTDITLDSSGDIILDADGAVIKFKDGGTDIASFLSGSQNLNIRTAIADKDIRLQGYDGDTSTLVTALTLDMSAAGAATFNAGGTFGSNVSITSEGDGLSLSRSGYDTYSLQHSAGVGMAIHNVTDSANEMLFDGAGNVSIQATKKFFVDGLHAGNGGDTFLSEYSANEFEIQTGGARRFALSGGNTFISGSLTQNHNFSDERLKENIVIIPNALEKVNTLRGITFTRKDDGSSGTGLIAQELEKVLPEAVYETKKIDSLEDSDAEKYKAIEYGTTVGLLVEAIKELEARVKQLEG